jgi:hypothetical protein
MALARLLAPLSQLDTVAGYVNDHDVVFGCTDADTVIAVAALRERVSRPIGLWLVLDPDYSAQLAARDIATLSWLVALGPVVIEHGSDAAAHADIVRALLTNDEVNIANDVATIRGAYNRPAPPTPLDVWSVHGTELRRGETVLRIAANEELAFGERTDFE